MERIEFKDESCKKARTNAIEEFAGKLKSNLACQCDTGYMCINCSIINGIKKQMLKSDDFKSFDSNESQVLEKK